MEPLTTLLSVALYVGSAVVAPKAPEVTQPTPREVQAVIEKRRGKVYVGMSEADLEKTFGEPEDIRDNHFAKTGTVTISYTGQHCKSNITIGDACSVNVLDGVVVSHSNFRPKFIAR